MMGNPAADAGSAEGMNRLRNKLNISRIEKAAVLVLIVLLLKTFLGLGMLLNLHAFSFVELRL